MKKYEFILKGLHCAGCANEIQEKLQKNPKLYNVNVNFAKLKLTYETEEVSIQEVKKAVKEQEPDVELIEDSKDKLEDKGTITKQILRLALGIVLALIGLYVRLPLGIGAAFAIIGYSILLYRTAKNALKMILKSKKINGSAASDIL